MRRPVRGPGPDGSIVDANSAQGVAVRVVRALRPPCGQSQAWQHSTTASCTWSASMATLRAELSVAKTYTPIPLPPDHQDMAVSCSRTPPQSSESMRGRVGTTSRSRSTGARATARSSGSPTVPLSAAVWWPANSAVTSEGGSRPRGSPGCARALPFTQANRRPRPAIETWARFWPEPHMLVG